MSRGDLRVGWITKPDLRMSVDHNPFVSGFEGSSNRRDSVRPFIFRIEDLNHCCFTVRVLFVFGGKGGREFGVKGK